jgi:hypothetical protein
VLYYELMDTQSTPTPEQAPRLPAEQLNGAIMPEQMPAPAAPEVAPTPSAAPPSNTPAAAAPKLTADDVAAALAAVPMPTAPVVAAPVTADDVDVVEPEWVTAADQVIAQTAGNPYAEEEAFETLQVDYLKKRYGHEVKKPEGK